MALSADEIARIRAHAESPVRAYFRAVAANMCRERLIEKAIRNVTVKANRRWIVDHGGFGWGTNWVVGAVRREFRRLCGCDLCKAKQ